MYRFGSSSTDPRRSYNENIECTIHPGKLFFHRAYDGKYCPRLRSILWRSPLPLINGSVYSLLLPGKALVEAQTHSSWVIIFLIGPRSLPTKFQRKCCAAFHWSG